MVSKFISKYYPYSKALQLRKNILNFWQLPAESVFEAWERFKSCLRKCPDHRILLVDQILTFYYGITMIDREKITMADGGNIMRKTPQEAYDLIENMTLHHFQWDAEVYYDTTTGVSAQYSKTTYVLSHPNTIEYTYSDESDEDEPSKVDKSEINLLIKESTDTFLMGDEEIELNSHKDIDDLVPILRTILSLIFRMGRVMSPKEDYNRRDYVPGPEHPSSPDYVPGPEHPPSPIEIPYVPEPEYPEYLAPSDDEAHLEDQPLPVDASPIAASPDYVVDSDPEEDLEDDQADYPADGGDGDDEPSDDDDDDDTDDEDPEEEPFEDEEDDKEEEQHLAPVDSFAVPIVDPTRLRRARKTVRLEPSMSASVEACIARHAALPSPLLLVPSLPLPSPSLLTTSPTDTGAPLGYRAAGIKMRALLSSTSRRSDTLEADMPPRKRACLTTPALGFKIRESSAAGAARQPGPTESDLRRYRVEQAGYGITDTWDEIVDTLKKIALTTLEGVNERVTELDITVRQRTDEFEIRSEEAQDDRALLRARVNTLFRDRPDHRRTAMLMDREAMYAREAWAFSEDRSSAIAAHVRTLETQALIDRGVAAALADGDADRSRNGDNSNDSGTGGRRQMTTPRECTYTNFLKCQPMSFQGTEGVVGLTRWLEKMESVFQISNCTVACQDVAYAMPLATLKRMITDKYCPRGEIQKLEYEFWNLKVKGLDMLNYNQRFQELVLMCDRMFPEESAKVERYIGGLPDMIHGSVKASKPQSMQEAIEFTT
nr:hypothetical protein [Tanacetum cinerariifolium]